jgi:prepilin-type N-terminal cleavage/methylation domain-containing protein
MSYISIQKKAFSLVELSIVLVVLGLLVGGVLSGQSLIRAAELRSVSSEFTRWVTASQTFRDKYFALPGDMTNATSFWGKSATLCNGDTGAAQTPGTCNGDGDGYIEVGAGGNAKAEMFAYWQQLANAGLIEGTYDAASGPSTGYTALVTNAPKAKLSSGYWIMYSYAGVTFTGNASIFDGTYRENLFEVGGLIPNSSAENPLLKPQEVWNIDTKLDDGRPAYGVVRVRFPTTCTTAASSADLSASYKLDGLLPCVPMFNLP